MYHVNEYATRRQRQLDDDDEDERETTMQCITVTLVQCTQVYDGKRININSKAAKQPPQQNKEKGKCCVKM